MKTLGIFGTAGFASEVDDIAHELGWHALYVARDATERAAFSGAEDVIVESEVLRHKDMPFAIGIADPAARQAISQRYRGVLRFPNLIHPAASFGKKQRQAIDASSGVVIGAGARFMSRISVGDFCAFDLNVTVGHDCRIEDFVHIAPGANISGNVHIGARCWIGTGAAINQGSAGRKLLIGPDTIVGSGAVVLRDCEPRSTYVGCPARKLP
jgi:sugar O-acyltransferase (sialic acid O-acetyltransferase NeuD family)